MNKTTLAILSFVTGAAVSAVATYFITVKKMKRDNEIYIAQQLANDRKELKEREDKQVEDIRKDAVDEYCDKVRAERRELREHQKRYSTADKSVFKPFDPEDESVKEALERSRTSEEPYIIDEDEHYDGSGYDLRTLFYHPDAGDVADDTGMLVDPDECVGAKIFNDFVSSGEDEIFVRNPFLMIDFNIQTEMLK